MHISELDRLNAVGDPHSGDTRVASKALWRDCPYFQISHGLRNGTTFFDDFTRSFVQATNVAAASTTLADPFAAFTDNDASCVIASIAEPTDALGAMSLATGAANVGCHVGVFTQKNTGTIIDPSGLASAASTPVTCRVWLEARLKVSSVTAAHLGFFFGLMEKSRVVTLGTIATGGAAPAAVDHIGFFKDYAGTTAVQTFIGNGTSTAVSATAGTMAADTYINLGLKWDGNKGSLGLATFYVNGTQHATTVTSATTQFPLGEGLSPHIGVLGGASASADKLTVDWVRFAYLKSV